MVPEWQKDQMMNENQSAFYQQLDDEWQKQYKEKLRLITLTRDPYWLQVSAQAFKSDGLLVNISVQSIIATHWGKFFLKVLGSVFLTSSLLGQRIKKLSFRAITGIHFEKKYTKQMIGIYRTDMQYPPPLNPVLT